LEGYYTSDCGFIERIQLETVAESMPEDVAGRLGTYFATTK
jgi:hypothetical protein